MKTIPAHEVLIAGAGPSGLALALWLARSGVQARIVEQQGARPTTSRAIAVQTRTLELYRQLGIADEAIARGRKLDALNFWVAGEKVARLPFGDLARERSPYPFILMLSQDEHERLLEAALAAEGVLVERGVTLTGFEAEETRVRAELRRWDGRVEECEAAYLAGCDGARSLVRHRLGATFRGGTYQHLFYVADLDASGPGADGELHVALDEANFVAAFPLKDEGETHPGEGRVRLIGTVRPCEPGPLASGAGHAESPDAASFTWDDVDKSVLKRVGVNVRDVHWFSTYHVHHRVVDRFSAGRVFLVGDAAHIHSPVGGQGMNTGIGDAVNLGWKLAEVIHRRAPVSLLDSYEPERRGFATRLVDTTDKLFQLVTREGGMARWVRTHLFPRIVPRIFDTTRGRAYLFSTVSQTRLQYRKSPLSWGQAGALHAGDRWPWVPDATGDGDSFTFLQQRRWQGIACGGASGALDEVHATCARHGIDVRRWLWRPELEEARLERDAFYLVRPDGYLGLVEKTPDAAAVDAYLSRHCAAMADAA